jgi:single-strand DNA-binding protein
MSSAALRPPSVVGTYSSPAPAHDRSFDFLFYRFCLLENSYQGTGTTEKGKAEQIYSSFKKTNFMEITGRLVADATVRNVTDDKAVTNFRLAINRRYTSGGEQKEETTFVDCAYWRTAKLAPYLTKGLLVQLYGHISAKAWVSRDGEPMASLNFHTNEITLLGKSAGNDTDKPTQAGDKNKVIKPS